MKIENVICVNIWIEPDWDGEYQLSIEYTNKNDEWCEKSYSRKTLKGALKYARTLCDKYGTTVNLI